MLTDSQIKQFREQGFLLLDSLFSPTEVDLIKNSTFDVIRKETPKRILEKNGGVRTYFTPEEDSTVFEKVGKLDRMVKPVEQLLESPVYIHQSKINIKQAVIGDWWEWHQDFLYWHVEDGMPTPRVLTAVIFIDEINEFNGPMYLVPGSHKAGIVDSEANDVEDENQKEWYMSTLTSTLKYTLKPGTISKWVKNDNIVSAKGPAGSVLLFDGLIFHASPSNLSPWNRMTYLISYNSCENALAPKDKPRPYFLANRNFASIQSIADDSLIKELDVVAK